MRRRQLLLVAAALLAVVGLAGTASAARKTSSAEPQPMSAAAWRKLVGQAKAEGKVVIYSVQNPAGLQALANAFKEKFGITVTVNRNIDSVLQSQIDAEQITHNAIADIWVPSQRRLVYGSIKNGWVVDPQGPNFFSKSFDRKTWMFGK